MKITKGLSNWLPPFLWMAMIYLFSTSTFSAENTASFLLPILRDLGVNP